MKKVLIPIMIIAIIIALLEQNKEEKSIPVLIISFVVFMFGMMRLSSKTPSKNQDDTNENVQ
jgi:hypothetical protein